MASSFEKSVKGATKIKVSQRHGILFSHLLLTSLLPGRSSENEIHRAHPYSNSFGRVRCRGGVPIIAEPSTRLNMDSSVQKSHHRAPDDKRGFPRCYVRFSCQS